MPAVYIVTDSTADLPPGLAHEYDISVVPLKIFFGQKVYLDGVDLSPSEFFARLSAVPELPATSQPTPAEFVAKYKPLVEQGAFIISIHLSSGLSGTVHSARLAKKMLDYEQLAVIDARTAGVSLGMVALAAARAAREGRSGNEVLKIIEYMLANQNTYLMVDTLDYLQRGGRIGRATAFLGTLLNVKPLLHIQDGLVHPYEKARGKKKALHRLVEMAVDEYGQDEVLVYLTHGNDPDSVEIVRGRVEQRLHCREILIAPVGAVIGTHLGPGVLGLGICRTEGLE